MRAIKGIDRRVTRKLGVVPLDTFLINSLKFKMVSTQLLDRFMYMAADPEVDIAPTVKGIRFPRFHFQPSPRRGQLISIGQKATTKLGEGRKGIRHTGRVAYLNKSVRHEIYLSSATDGHPVGMVFLADQMWKRLRFMRILVADSSGVGNNKASNGEL